VSVQVVVLSEGWQNTTRASVHGRARACVALVVSQFTPGCVQPLSASRKHQRTNGASPQDGSPLAHPLPCPLPWPRPPPKLELRGQGPHSQRTRPPALPDPAGEVTVSLAMADECGTVRGNPKHKAIPIISLRVLRRLSRALGKGNKLMCERTVGSKPVTSQSQRPLSVAVEMLA